MLQDPQLAGQREIACPSQITNPDNHSRLAPLQSRLIFRAGSSDRQLAANGQGRVLPVREDNSVTIL